MDNYIESSTTFIAEVGMSIFVIMAKYGIRVSGGNIIMPPIYSSIDYLLRKLLAVRKGLFVALFDTEGKQLTEFKYPTISCSEDGFVLATRNEVTGRLDDNGNEIADTVHFNGGYIKICSENILLKIIMGKLLLLRDIQKLNF